MTGLTEASRRRLRSGLPVAALALVAYIPVLLSSPGTVGGDTKSYLTIDPSRWLSRVEWLWSPSIGAGGVTHQNVGYLWPMGPWFWVFDKLGVPMWMAQRLWLGTILFLAGAGVLWLMRRFVDPRIAVAAAFFYMLSPYLLHYSERMSVLLLPWAGLPWMLGLTARARDQGTWRAPALFALLTATIGGINATSIMLVGLAPLLWLAYGVALPRSAGVVESLRTRVRHATSAALRIGVLTLLTNAWWIAGLRTQGTFGLPVLRYTETYETVANSAVAQEMLRGLGHWYFYGSDRIGAWVQPSVTYTENLTALSLSFLVPVLALAGLALVRFRHKTFFLALTVVGLLVAVGAHPFDAPSVLGGIFKAFTGTETGLAMRSTPRALPLVELGLAAGFGAGTAALAAAARRVVAARRPPVRTGSSGSALAGWGRWAPPGVVVLACLLVMANLSPLFVGQATADTLTRDEQIPQYWLDAAGAIDAGDHGTRVLEVPGSDFAAYRWGDIVDPLTPGITDRPYLARELIPNGEPASAALLLALDRRYQEGTAEEDALVPIAQLLGVGDVVLRNDLEYERFNTPRPYVMWNTLIRTPGLLSPHGFGAPGRNDAQQPKPLLDEKALAEPASQPATPPVALFRLKDPLPIVRTVPYASPMLVAGDGEGLVDMAALGLLDPRQAIVFSASYADDAEGLQELIDAGATLSVTDTNAKRGLRWGSVRENEGYVERADESALRADPSENRLEVFPTETTASQTVAIQRGATVDATAYGNPVSFTPENRPYLAFDGDPTTWWSVGALDDAVGERITVRLDAPTQLDHLTLLQAPGNRHISKARVTVGDEHVDVDLGPESLTAPGQTVTFPTTTADRVQIEVLATDPGGLASYDDFSGVGFSEVAISGVKVNERLRLPTDLLDAVGTADLAHPLYVVVTRNRTDPTNPGRLDPERSMHRQLTLPSGRSFTLLGDVRLDSAATATQLATYIGGRDGATASASSWLPGDIANRGRAAFDGDASTWWTPQISDTRGAWVQLDAPAGASPGTLTVTYAADGRHSVPSRISIQADGTTIAVTDVPDVVDGPFGTTASITIPIPAGATATSWRATVDDIWARSTTPWLGGGDYDLPVAIASVDGLGTAPAPLATSIDTGCRSDLVTINGQPVAARVTGSVADANAGRPLQLLGCADLPLPAGEVTIDTFPGASTGLSVDRLALASLTGGGAVPAAVTGSMDAVVAALQPTPPTSQPSVTVTAERPDRVDLEIDGLDERSWLVLGESLSEGWTATSPELGDLGAPSLIQGYANGWTLDPTGGTVHVTLEWGPQKVVWAGIGVSLLAVLACLAIVLVPVVLRRRRPDRAPGPPDDGYPLALDRPDRPGGRRATLAGGIGVGVFAALNLPQDRIILAIGLAVGLGLATGLVIRTGRGQTSLAWLAPGALAAAGIYSVAKEWRGGYASSEWPQIFDPVHILGIFAVLVLAALAAVNAWRDERGSNDLDGGVRTRPIGAGDP